MSGSDTGDYEEKTFRKYLRLLVNNFVYGSRRLLRPRTTSTGPPYQIPTVSQFESNSESE